MKNTSHYLAHIGCLQITGPDVVRFLQGQLTCHVEALNPHESCFSAYCTPQGRIISLFHLYKAENICSLFMPRALVGPTLQALKKFAVFFKVALKDASDEYTIIGCFEEAPHQPRDDDRGIMQIPISKTRCLRIYKRDTQLETAMTSSIWQLANIEEGLPTIYPETLAHFLPHDLNLDLLGALHFDKGCYTGQEIIARMQYRGKIKNRLHTACIHNHSPKPGESVMALLGKETRSIGEIVDAAPSIHPIYKLLLVISENDANNTPVFLKSGETLIPLSLQQENFK
jgi:tRNA-modifying protein YgfZ